MTTKNPLRNITKLATLILCTYALQLNAKNEINETMTTTAPITIDSVGLTGKDFFLAYTNDSAEERKFAELYLLGVMDATEGRSWCDYRTFKTITLRERIFESFKTLNESEKNERAALIIERILNDRYPCGDQK